MILRPYQDRAISDLRAAYAAGHRAPCLVLPTGGGKTVVAAAIVRGAIARGRRVLFLAHRAELLGQTVSKLSAAGLHDVRLIRAAHDTGNPLAPVTVASIPTLTRWIDRMPRADLVVFDECHHTVAKTWARIATAYAGALLLGMTATPQRSDGKPLGDVFDALVVGSTVRELVDLGHLVPCRVWAPTSVLDTAELARSPLEAYRQFADGQRAVIFCVTVEHAEQVAAEMTDAGVPTGVVDGTGSAERRAATLARFRAGELRAIANVHVLTEGWDDPGVAVCILARKPQHAGTFLQMAGRVLRPAEGKASAMLIDLCGSVHDHGTPDMDREFSLDGKGISKSDREPIRQCPSCGSVFRSAPVCPVCAVTLPAAPIAMPRSVNGELVAVTAPTVPSRPITLSITAKYASRCSRCMGYVGVGSQIYWTRGSKLVRHVDCSGHDVLDAANAAMRSVM